VKRGHEPSADGPLWADGWHPSAQRLESPNFGARPDGMLIDLVLIHSISLPPGVYGGDAVSRLFTNRLDWDAHPYFQSIRGQQVSAHFLITRTGQLLQFVSCEARAWHAGVSSHQGRDNCNDYSIGVELEGLEGGHFEAHQYARLRQLLVDLAGTYPLRYLAGHSHVAPGRKIDPGHGFEWAQLAEVAADLHLALPR
jgi:N-acetyl-anhydromuramoyl-L-alanine amidase